MPSRINSLQNGSELSALGRGAQTVGSPIRVDAISLVPAPIRTLQIGNTTSESSGGAQRYYFNLLRAAPACGVTPAGLAFGDAAALNGVARVSSFATEGTGLLKRWASLRESVRSALPNSDLVVSHFALYAFPVLDLIRKLPLVTHFHGPWGFESAAEGAGSASVFVKRALERIVYAGSSRLIVLSRAFAMILEREYGIANDRIRIIPGGVDVARFAPAVARREARRVLGWPTDRPIVLSVRRLVHAKGLENLIDAVSTIRSRVPDVLVIIAGTGPLGGILKRRVTERGLEHHVRFAGFVPDDQLPTLYRAADLFVVPTIALEGFGLVVVEALASGTPVLVTPIAGLPEVITDLDAGLVLRGARSQDLAQGISDALTGSLPLPTSAQCITYAQRFAWASIAPRIAAVYREIA